MTKSVLTKTAHRPSWTWKGALQAVAKGVIAPILAHCFGTNTDRFSKSYGPPIPSLPGVFDWARQMVAESPVQVDSATNSQKIRFQRSDFSS